MPVGFPPYNFPSPFGQGYPNMGPMFATPFGFGFNRPAPRARPRRNLRGVCFYCKASGHFVNECPKMKKE